VPIEWHINLGFIFTVLHKYSENTHTLLIMPPPPTYQQLFDSIYELAKKYNLAEYMNGYDAELINILLDRDDNIKQLKAADSYEKTIQMANTALSNYATGGWFPGWLGVNVESYVTDVNDRQRLYALCSQWRHMKINGQC